MNIKNKVIALLCLSFLGCTAQDWYGDQPEITEPTPVVPFYDTCIGDLNGDGMVDALELKQITEFKLGIGGIPLDTSVFDLNNDNTVDGDEYGRVLTNSSVAKKPERCRYFIKKEFDNE